MQSAYRPGHSTETALLHVHYNILRAVDEHKAVALVLLDLSAAFDTIDHNIMLSRLSKRLGVGDVALKWFESYLKGRKQSVVINETLSSPLDVLYGVPQGSVLGPKLFTIYTLPIDIARKYNLLEIHLYADDTQIFYIIFRTSDNNSEETAIKLVRSCIAEIKIWMLINKLQLNDGKTKFLLIASPYFRKTITTTHINIGNDKVPIKHK